MARKGRKKRSSVFVRLEGHVNVLLTWPSDKVLESAGRVVSTTVVLG